MTHPPDLAAALQHERALRRLACMLHLGGADADDAVQHALTQAALGKRPPGMPIWTFLRTSLKRHAWNLHKLAGRRRAREAAAAGTEAVMPVDDMLARDQLRRRVAEAVLALAEPYRTTVWLRWFEGLAVDEVAARMAAPPNTVRTRLQRAHALLKSRLDRDYGEGRWGAWALPVGAIAGAGSKVASVAAVAATAIAFAIALGLWWSLPGAGDPELPSSPVPVVADAPPAASEQALHEPSPKADPRTAPVVEPAPEFLQVVHHGGRELADAPVWWWSEADRPAWTAAPERSGAVQVFAEGEEQALPGPTAFRTDANGRVPLPTPRPVAVTIGIDVTSWVSSDLTRLRLELPKFVDLRATVKGAPHDAGWEGRFVVVRDDEPGEWDVAGDLSVGVTTPTGRLAMRIVTPRPRLAASEALQLRVPAGLACRWSVDAVGHGFVLSERPPPREAPESFWLTAGRPVLRHVVTVLAPGGLVTDLPGFVHVQRRDGGWDTLPLDGGRAVFDRSDYGASPAIGASMIDGERATAAPKSAVAKSERSWVVPLRGVSDAQHVHLPGLQLRDVHRVFVEDDSRHWLPAPRLDRRGAAGQPEHGFDGHGLWIAGLRVLAGRQVCVVARSGRAATGTFTWLGTAEAAWLPALPAVDIAAARFLREYGAGASLRVVVELGLPEPDGALAWQSLWWHRRRDGGPPPVWAGRTLPMTMPWRLRVLDDAEAPPRELLVRTTLP